MCPWSNQLPLEQTSDSIKGRWHKSCSSSHPHQRQGDLKFVLLHWIPRQLSLLCFTPSAPPWVVLFKARWNRPRRARIVLFGELFSVSNFIFLSVLSLNISNYEKTKSEEKLPTISPPGSLLPSQSRQLGIIPIVFQDLVAGCLSACLCFVDLVDSTGARSRQM